jgi:hypothetical protein
MKKRKLKKLLNGTIDENNFLYELIGDLKYELNLLKEQNNDNLATVSRLKDEVKNYVSSHT